MVGAEIVDCSGLIHGGNGTVAVRQDHLQAHVAAEVIGQLKNRVLLQLVVVGIFQVRRSGVAGTDVGPTQVHLGHRQHTGVGFPQVKIFLFRALARFNWWQWLVVVTHRDHTHGILLEEQGAIWSAVAGCKSICLNWNLNVRTSANPIGDVQSKAANRGGTVRAVPAEHPQLTGWCRSTIENLERNGNHGPVGRDQRIHIRTRLTVAQIDETAIHPTREVFLKNNGVASLDIHKGVQRRIISEVHPECSNIFCKTQIGFDLIHVISTASTGRVPQTDFDHNSAFEGHPNAGDFITGRRHPFRDVEHTKLGLNIGSIGHEEVIADDPSASIAIGKI